MRTLMTLGEIVVLVAIGTGLGFGANRLRGPDVRIDVGHDYFPIARPAPASGDTAGGPTHGPARPAPAVPDSATGSRPEGVAPSADAPAPYHAEHEFQTITADEILDLLDSPDTAAYLNVIVDARDDEHFEAGHIPGAMQCYNYQFKKYLPNVEPYVTAASKVIVYCGGGECEDSIFLCRLLESELGVLRENLYLYEGGWTEWSRRGLPTATGRDD